MNVIDRLQNFNFLINECLFLFLLLSTHQFVRSML